MACRRDEAGFSTIQYVVATGFSLLLFVMVANLLVDLYDRGAVRGALDEGVRAGVPVAAGSDACAARVHEVIDSIASGSSLTVDDVSCVPDGGRVVATATI